MIRLDCANCQAALTLDDAFAGGVCRCQHCGTIQTVPSHMKGNANPSPTAKPAPAAAGAPGRGPAQGKALYQSRAGGDGPSSGLDELANIVASSGLSRSALKRPPVSAAPAAPSSRLLLPVLIGAALLVLLLVGVIAFLVLRKNGQGPAGDGPTGPGDQRPPTVVQRPTPTPTPGPTPTVKPGQPAFLNIKLDEPSVIYVIDRGQSTREALPYLLQACYRSIQGLGPDRKFQIILWKTSDADASWPPGAAVPATEANLASCKSALAEAIAFGQSDAKPALEKAIAQNPAAIVLATAKGWDLDESFVKMAMEVRRNAAAKIHAVSVGQGATSAALQELARKTGGEYREVSVSELRSGGP